jgi:hypothetical protein
MDIKDIWLDGATIGVSTALDLIKDIVIQHADSDEALDTLEKIKQNMIAGLKDQIYKGVDLSQFGNGNRQLRLEDLEEMLKIIERKEDEQEIRTDR